ncbi:MAG: ABC transporter ATP-binding protein [Acidobacteriota bacterium]
MYSVRSAARAAPEHDWAVNSGRATLSSKFQQLPPDVSLVVDGLGKCFYIQETESAKKPKGVWARVKFWPERLRHGVTQPFGGKREFWALRNVSFTVKRGTVLGVIGPNGAGKSTLLKVIARVTPPTEGRVRGVGRVVSLLELGAGFNPEVSARENIIMNAAMYGVPRTDIEKHFDDIIAFAEIEQFVDTPLKFYSSGMYLRLAFSVAVNMRPQILIADEILAVGDIAFQERCLARVSELANDGLTVLFVSHDMEAILKVCNEVIWLNGGRIQGAGDPDKVVTEYQNVAWAKNEAARTEKGRHSNRNAELIAAKLVSQRGREIGAAPIGEEVGVRIRFSVQRPLKARIGFDLTHRGGLIFRTMTPEWIEIAEPGLYEALGRIPPSFLTEILYGVNAFLIMHAEGKESSLIIYGAVSFMGYDNERGIEKQQLQKGGLLAPRLEWSLKKETLVNA